MVTIKINRTKNILLLIIGKNSNLTRLIEKNCCNTVSFSSQEMLANVNILNQYKDDRVVILFNNFQTAKYLNCIDNIEEYVNRSITVTAKVLDFLKNFTNIQKIMYTSSSSVYGDNECCSEDDVPHPISLQASLKLSNEFFIKQYCKNKSIDYTIIRIFNMYGENDNFSIVSKIINAIKNNETLSLINNGSGIRDFIHIGDVVSIIIKLLTIESVPILNIGTGNKKSVRDVIDYLSSKNINVCIKNIKNDNEIKISIANINKLRNIFKNDFINVEEYILKELQKEENKD